MFATVSYLTIVVLQTAGLLGFTHPPAGDAAVVAAFNLLVLNIVGWLAALLAEAYRAGRHRLTALNVELERAHDESLRMNSQIQRAARRYVLGEVVAGVTHEVRNALQGAFGHLWLASRKPGMPPEALEHLKQVEGACEDAMRILRNTLDLAPRPEPDRQPVVLAEVARHVAEVKSFDLRRDGITLRVDVPETLPLVRGAAFQLEQVVLNLVVNAQDELRGRPGRREIAILGTAEAGHAVLEVHDSGPGIAPAALGRLFEPFYTTKPGGAGLGLAISAGIVEAFGGKLTADNRRRAGAIFRLELPPAPPEDSAII
jgi:signal transduction histidine kinase